MKIDYTKLNKYAVDLADLHESKLRAAIKKKGLDLNDEYELRARCEHVTFQGGQGGELRIDGVRRLSWSTAFKKDEFSITGVTRYTEY